MIQAKDNAELAPFVQGLAGAKGQLQEATFWLMQNGLSNPENAAAARALGPIHDRQVFGRSILLYDRADRAQLAALGDVRTPSIADLFVAVMTEGGAR